MSELNRWRPAPLQAQRRKATLWNIFLPIAAAVAGAVIGLDLRAHFGGALGDLLTGALWGAALGAVVGRLATPFLMAVYETLGEDYRRGVQPPRKLLVLGAVTGAIEGATIGALCGDILGAVDGAFLGGIFGYGFWGIAWRVRYHVSVFVLSLLLGMVIEAAGGLAIGAMAMRVAADKRMAWLFASNVAVLAGVLLLKLIWWGFRRKRSRLHLGSK